MIKDEALKMAFNALKLGISCQYEVWEEALNACKEALEQPAKEPVAWTDEHNLFLEFDKEWLCNKAVCKDHEAIPLYTHPAPSWQGLSNDEIQSITWKVWGADALEPELDYARAIEQALKEKNTDR